MKSETFTISLEKGAQDSIPFYSPASSSGLWTKLPITHSQNSISLS